MSSQILQNVTDQYSFLDYKDSFWNPNSLRGTTTGATMMAPSWVGNWNWRRVKAYMFYEDYYRNAARRHMSSQAEEEDKLNRREYGDSFLIVEMLLTSLIGNQQQIYVDLPLSANPSNPIEATDDLGKEDKPDSPEGEYFDTLKEWGRKEKLFLKVQDAERSAIKLGDAVYVLGWSDKADRPKLSVWDPGFYFPVLDDDSLDENGWPTKIHIAYEFCRRVGGEEQVYLRRITWELRDDLAAPRNYKWQEKPSNTACYMTDMEWLLSDAEAKNSDVQDLSRANGKVRNGLDNTDLQIDFIPVIHIPNTAWGSEHFGVSTLGPLMQILDDVQATDSDLALSSATTGSPPIAVHGATMMTDDEGRITNYGPRTVLETGEGGASLLDTSRSLDALLKYKEALADDLAEKSRLPKTLLGRVDPSKVPSGIVLTLSFSPHSGLIRAMRELRDEKYSLMLDYAGRFMMSHSKIDKIFPAFIKFGSYLPADKTEVMNLVVQGLQSHSISMDTAILMLIESGFPIDDAKEEIAKIIMEDFDAAGKLLDATGEINDVRKRLNMAAAPEPILQGGFDKDGNPVNPTGPGPKPKPPALPAGQ